jgi:hypothetical protein
MWKIISICLFFYSLLYLEDGGYILLRNITNHCPGTGSSPDQVMVVYCKKVSLR